ncbi:hypothetical protein ANN_00888 [Periplaneta americana]|uniref:Uncharacterized protein n=1 Tax=Periplaneta americana TaxID=6978 RepID=A0ABQ8TS60_PERAM|nr:hypothetical protein ANN_00888 [Periplaneta americana]
MDLRDVGYGDRGWINLAQDSDRWRAYSEIDFVSEYNGNIAINSVALANAWYKVFSEVRYSIRIATGVAQSVKALACRSKVALGRGFDPRLGCLPDWVFSEVFPNRKVNARYEASLLKVDAHWHEPTGTEIYSRPSSAEALTLTARNIPVPVDR